MAVRFLPPPEDRTPANRDEGENLAEVVEMRSWLRPAPVAEATEAEEPAPSAWSPADESWAGGVSNAGTTSLESESSEGEASRTQWGAPTPAVDSDETTSDSSASARVTRVRFGSTPADRPESADSAEFVEAAVESAAPVESKRKRGSVKRADRAVAVAAPSGSNSDSESNRSLAYEDAVKLLARRARSSGELRDDLLALDHPSDEVSIIIDEFIENHYLDDVGLARLQSEKLRDSKGASRGQIARKLRERKLPDAVVEEILGELDVDEEYSLLREAASKRAERLTGLDRPTAQRRLLGFLARRGWSGEPAMRAANEALDGGLGRGGRGSGGVRFE